MFLGERRQSSRLDWAESSWTRWIQIPLLLWVTPIVSLGNKRTLVEDDLNDLSLKDKCSVLLGRVYQDGSKWKGTWHVFSRVFFKDFLMSILLTLPLNVARIAQPLLIRQIVLYIKGETELPLYAGYLYAIGLCHFCNSTSHYLLNNIFFRNTRIGMRVRQCIIIKLSISTLLTINTAALHKTTAAQTINLVANDAGKFEELSLFVHFFVLIPVETLATFGLIWWNIGLPTLFGYAVLILLVPIQLIFSRKFSQYRKATMTCTDKRVQAINELVNGCQIIKMYNWEKAMEQRVRETRRHELSNIYKASCLEIS